ncbi:MAG: hypothetical protein M3Z64_08070 [Verrucomicrobiota bacterium]|nr:hypothetical protein [Verrucomicrobiota bacterium]
MRGTRAFTLIEISISVFILLLLIMVAVPSLSGVMADRRLRRSLDDLNRLVHQAQDRSISEHRPYLIVWGKDALALLPEAATKDEEKNAFVLKLRRGDAYQLGLPAALEKDPPGQWIFWSSGACEPAVITFKGVDGSWVANYSPLTARAELAKYGR